MAFMDDFESMLAQTIDVEPWSGQDDAGVKSYGSAVTYSCRISDFVEAVRDDRGIVREGRHKIYMNATTTFSTVDRLTLPSGYEPTQPSILRVQRMIDEDGAAYTVLWTGYKGGNV